jgi:peptide/nickel transport system substrate-binding protein
MPSIRGCGSGATVCSIDTIEPAGQRTPAIARGVLVMRRIGRLLYRCITLAVLALATALTPAQAGTFRFADQGDVLSLDPHMLNEGLLLNFTGNLYEGLTGRGRNLELVPELATDWKQTAPTVWRFNLRRGVKFHDGTPFTADDVIFSLGRAQGEGANMASYVGAIREITKIDAHTIDVTTHVPYPILPESISLWRIMSQEWCRKHDALRPADVRKGTENFASSNANGTGPFMLKSRQPGVRTVLVPHPAWWGKAEHNLSEAVFTPIANDATRVAALLSGDVDLIQPVPLQDVARLEGRAGIKVMSRPELRTIFLGMDQKRDELLFSSVKGRNPFKDQRVRRAIYHAIDIEAIRSRIMRGVSAPAALMVAPGINGFAAELDHRLPYDPELARTLLAQAGYADGFEVDFNCPNDRYVNDAEICQAIAAMLARVGVRASLIAEPKATYFPKVLRRDTSFYLLGWTPASFDSHDALYALMATPGEGAQGQYNLGVYSNARVDELTRLIASETDAGLRQKLITEAFRIHQDDVGHIPLHQQPITWAMKRNVQPVQLPDNHNYLRWIVVGE